MSEAFFSSVYNKRLANSSTAELEIQQFFQIQGYDLPPLLLTFYNSTTAADDI
jgi:hypothetical protein